MSDVPFRNPELDIIAAQRAAKHARMMAEETTDLVERKRHLERAAWFEERARIYEDFFYEPEDDDDGSI